MRRSISAAVVLAALAAPAPAQAIALVGNDAGDALALIRVRSHYLRSTELATRSGAGEFGSPFTLESSLAALTGPVAMNERGDAVAAWKLCCDTLLASVRPAGGTFEQPVTLSSRTRIGGARIAVNERGDAVVIWGPERANLRGGIVMAVRPAGGRFSEPFRFEPTEDRVQYSNYDVGLADDGTAIVVWAGFHDPDLRVDAAMRFPDGSFGPAQTLSPPGQEARPYRLVVNGSGAALVTWPAGSPGSRRIVASERAPGGAFGPPFDVSTPEDRDAAYPAALELNDDGAALVAWESGTKPYLVRAAIRPPGGAFERATIHTARSDTAYVTAVHGALNSRGDTAFSWREDDRLEGAYRSADGTLVGPFELARVRPLIDFGQADEVLIDSTGRATTAWEEANGEQALERVRSFGPSGAGARVTLVKRRSWFREAPASACRPRNTRTLAETRQVRAYEVTKGWNRGYAYGCLYARGVPVELGYTYNGVFGGPAVSIAGPLVGSAAESCDAETCSTSVDVTDVRDQSSVQNGGVLVQVSTVDTAKVGSVRLRRDGALGFITCPEHGTFPGERQPTCIRPGSYDRVWVADAYHRRAKKMVDSGRGIDPASLRLDGSVLSWLKNGKRHTYRLP